MNSTCGSAGNFLPAHNDLLRQAGNIRFQTIPLDKLAFPEELFDRTAPDNGLPYAQLLVPLIVSENPDGTHTIIDGCKRYSMIKGENRSECACGITAALDPFQRGVVRVLLNRGRQLSLREQFLFYKWLKGNGALPDKSASGIYLDLPWKRITELEEMMICPPDVLDAVFSQSLHPQNAHDFRLLSGNDRSAFLALFSGLDLSQQTQHEFMEWMAELASAQKVPFPASQGFPEIESTARDAALNAPQKIQKIRSILHSLRFPEFDSVLKHWNKTACKVNPAPSRITFVPDPYFEKDRLEVRVKVSTPDNAREIFEKLAGIGAEDWRKLTGPVQPWQDGSPA